MDIAIDPMPISNPNMDSQDKPQCKEVKPKQRKQSFPLSVYR